MLVEFINQYGMQILYMFVTAIAGYVGIVLKNLCAKYLDDQTKRAVAESAVQFVEQVYKDMHGDDKLNAAMSAASDMLAEKGIMISDLELRVLLEAALAKLNDAFNTGKNPTN